MLETANYDMNFMIPQVKYYLTKSFHAHSARKHTHIGGQVTCVYCSGSFLIGLTCCPHRVGGAENRKRRDDVSYLHVVGGARRFDERDPSSASPVRCDNV